FQLERQFHGPGHWRRSPAIGGAPVAAGAFRSVNQESPEKVCTASLSQMKFSGIPGIVVPQI
ncbi:hypothetical protein, partial [Leisingera sp. F5]|uniref:hypothetical protein n=1 Tax=Leisingera sp. F5 TaxID=1813816 RepID=UPI0025BF6A3C